MRIELNEEQQLLRASVRRFAEEVVRPRAKEIDESGEFPRRFFDQAAELGLAGVAVPEAYGGSGMDTVSYCLVIEEISRVCATSGVILSVNNSLVCDPLLKFGSEEQKQRFLIPLASGKQLGCFALTEPGAGSDPAGLLSTARADGDSYVLNGNKVFITNGTHADVALVFASTDLPRRRRAADAARPLRHLGRGHRREAAAMAVAELAGPWPLPAEGCARWRGRTGSTPRRCSWPPATAISAAASPAPRS